RFVDVTGSSAVTFEHHSGDCDQKPFPAANGSGVAALDIDLDGRTDLYFLNGQSFPLSENGNSFRNGMFRNVGELSFADVTDPSGLAALAYSAGTTSGDFNLDGFPDIYLNCYGANHLYLNCGDGSYVEVAQSSGIADPEWGTSAAVIDFDNDGDPDIYSCNYAEWNWETNQFCGNREKNIRIFCSPRSIRPVADRLFENQGDGQFRDVLQTAGLDRAPGRGQGVIAADVDGDDLPDLYISNDLNANALFRNRGDGRFEDLTDLSGTGVDFGGQTQAGMGVDVADIDHNGLMEIFVTNYEGEHNAFYRNLGNGLFQDTSQSDGMAAPSMRWIGWGTAFCDFDRDGWSDLVITNGHTDNNLHEMGRDVSYEQPPLLFRNDHGRLVAAGTDSNNSYFRKRHPGRALCIADLNNDLAADLVFAHKDAPPAILRNNSATPDDRFVFSVTLAGTRSNRDGFGSVLRWTDDAMAVTYSSQVKSGGSYLSSNSLVVTLSLLKTRGEPRRIEVRWPAGLVEHPAVPSSPGHYVLIEGRGEFRRADADL
ncbi:MAG: CRTAC1 family protein, partial [Planctomycetaceae bacterium]|nr:CRTAC1 family protein [Planctomycetaceae bacterium]